MKPTPYLTFGRYVFLGKVSKRIRTNAIKAGLKPIPRRQMGRMIREAFGLTRIVKEGAWYDTVKY
jgi:hypothetical protein